MFCEVSAGCVFVEQTPRWGSWAGNCTAGTLKASIAKRQLLQSVTAPITEPQTLFSLPPLISILILRLVPRQKIQGERERMRSGREERSKD